MRLRDPHSSEATPPAPAPSAVKPLRLLIVDDEPAVRDALTVALEPRAAVVHHADSLASARRILLASPIDLALIDVRLPDGDGLRLADELTARKPAVPAIVITGQPSVDRAVGAIRAGAADFLAKPFNLDDLNRCVARAMTRREHDRALALRINKLRRTCRKLHKARSSVSQQVDILCSDLVTAYQQLAEEFVGSSRVDLQACKLEYSIVSPK